MKKKENNSKRSHGKIWDHSGLLFPQNFEWTSFGGKILIVCLSRQNYNLARQSWREIEKICDRFALEKTLRFNIAAPNSIHEIMYKHDPINIHFCGTCLPNFIHFSTSYRTVELPRKFPYPIRGAQLYTSFVIFKSVRFSVSKFTFRYYILRVGDKRKLQFLRKYHVNRSR